MKKLMLLLVMLMATTFVTAQLFVSTEERGVIDLNKEDVYIIEVYNISKGTLKIEVEIALDFGQDTKKNRNGCYLSYENGDKIVFNSPIDGMNHLERNGWSYRDCYLNAGTYGSVYFFLFTKDEKMSSKELNGDNDIIPQDEVKSVPE